MADDEVITNKMLLEHMQAMKNELQMQIAGIRSDVSSLRSDVQRIEAKMDTGFREVRLDIQALQEDLGATMTVQMKHGQQIAQLQAASL